MNLARINLLGALVLLAAANPASAGGDPVPWNKEKAAQYLDDRAKTWFEFSAANRGTGADRTTCVSCHTLVPYAMARPVLGKLAGAMEPTKFVTALLEQRKNRVEHWKQLDTPAFGLLYDSSDQKKKESWGTEAVLNALILAFDDQFHGRKEASDATKKALANLWQVQLSEGKQSGSWDWLNFGLDPWESTGARYYGAALAAIAVGTAPGYYKPGTDANLDKGVKLLRGYLREQLPTQNLNNRIWMLWASTKLEGLRTKEEQSVLIEAILEKQQADGGWSLSSLGTFTRAASEPQDTGSDGYATGLILHVLQTAGLAKDNAKIARGLAWLQTHQAETGEWRGSSVNRKRDPATHVGKFMSDAATAYAVLALSH